MKIHNIQNCLIYIILEAVPLGVDAFFSKAFGVYFENVIIGEKLIKQFIFRISEFFIFK